MTKRVLGLTVGLAVVGGSVAFFLKPAPAPAPAAAPATSALRLEDPLPLDPAIKVGTLSNGMTFYIRHNGRPEKRVSLRLAVKAGSLLEDDDQRGLAHFAEHMAFNGSANFKPGELVSYLESIGAQFGADANAFTSFDRTVYMLDVPTDKEGLVEKGLLALGDFAARATLDTAQIDKERGVVIEEWRGGLGSSQRIWNVQRPVLFHGSRHADRLPIGKPEVLRTAPAERLRAFVRDFYRPDRMAVIVVGDVTPAQIEAQIKRLFGDIAPTTDKRPLAQFPVPPHAETLVSVATDKEQQGSDVSVTYKTPRRVVRTVGDARREGVDVLLSAILNERFADLARRPDAPFLGASASVDDLSPDVGVFGLNAGVADGGIQTALRSLLLEGERLRRHGATADELDRAKKNILAFAENTLKEKDTRESPDLASECLDHFLDQEIHTGTEFFVELIRELLPTVTLADLQQRAQTLIHDDNRVILATAPQKPGLKTPLEGEIRETLVAVGKLEVTPWAQASAATELMAKKPTPGRVTASRKIEPLGVTVLTLSNSAEVWLKPTDFKKDEVAIASYAMGGASLADPKNINEARLTSQYLDEAGIGGLSPTDLEKVLAGKLAGGGTFVGDYTHGLNGGSRPEDLETALQLLHLAMTQPNDRPAAFETVRKQIAAYLANRATDPDAAFQDKLNALNTQDHYMSRALRAEDIPALKASSVLGFHRERFANAADFTFFVVGAFELEKVVPLIETYIGGLPSTGKRTSRFIDRGLKFPNGALTAEVRMGTEPRSATQLNFFADTGLDPVEVRHVMAAANILERRLSERLREALSGTYSVSVGHSDERPLRGYGKVSVSFGSDPARAASLVEATLAELAILRDQGPTAQDVAKEQEIERRAVEVGERENGYWIGALATSHQGGFDPLMVLKVRERIDALNVAVLKEAFRRYFPLDRRTQVTLMPAAGPSAAAPSPKAVAEVGLEPHVLVFEGQALDAALRFAEPVCDLARLGHRLHEEGRIVAVGLARDPLLFEPVEITLAQQAPVRREGYVGIEPG